MSLPDTVPLVVPSDHITALTGDPKEMVDIRQLEDPDEDPYKWFDKMLNSICSEYKVEQNPVISYQVGLMGLPGLCNTLKYFINKGLASNEILEMCINNLIEEANKVYVTILRKQRHS